MLEISEESMSDENEIEESEDELEAEEISDAEDDDSAGLSVVANNDAVLEEASIAARESLRKQIESDVEAFLARGGVISEIPANVVADPPRKPTSNYGGQPI
jgi:hypothetical protein